MTNVQDMDTLQRAAGGVDVDVLLAGIADRAQLMFDRSMRYSKTVLPGIRITHAAKRDRTQVQRWRRAHLVNVMSACGPVLDQLPYTAEFGLFQASCRRLHIAHEHTLVLWDLFRHVRVHNLTATIARQQLDTLCTLYQPLSQQMHTQQHMLLCTFCAYFHLDGLFRYDCDADQQTCARCNVPGAVLKINLLGRLLYIDRVPVVLAPGRARLTLYSALDVVLPKQLAQESRLEWGRQVNCIQFKNLLANVTFTQFFLVCNDSMVFYTQVYLCTFSVSIFIDNSCSVTKNF